MDRREIETTDDSKLDMGQLLGFEHLDLPENGQAEPVVADLLNKRGGGEGTPVSDRRLKTDVRKVGETASGLALYDFRYLGDDTVFRGVMAQDLLADPRFAEAVETRGGFHRVDYAKIGLSHLVTDEMRKAGARAVSEGTPGVRAVTEGTPA